jgi:hypothetical protein
MNNFEIINFNLLSFQREIKIKSFNSESSVTQKRNYQKNEEKEDKKKKKKRKKK